MDNKTIQNKNLPPLTRLSLQSFSARIGKIFSNLSIIFFVLCVSGLLSFLSMAIILLVGIVVTILTLGTIFVIEPNFWPSILSTTEITSQIATFLLNNFVTFYILSLAFSISSIVLLALDKQVKHTGRIVVNSIIIFLQILCLIFAIAGGKIA